MLTRLLLFLLFCLPFALNRQLVAQTCNSGNADPSVTICMPQSDATQSPIHLQIATNDSTKVDMLQVWYNGVKRWENPVSSADFFLAAESFGPYKITALAHDVSGRWFASSVSINITDQLFGCSADETASQGPRSVVICSPADGEIHFSPLFLSWSAKAASGEEPKSVQIFVDGKSVFQTPPGSSGGFPVSQVYLPMSVARHRISIQGYDSQGSFKSTVYMKVNKIHLGCPPPTVMPDINVCSLKDGQNVNGVIPVQAAAAASTGIKHFAEILDGTQVFAISNHAWLDNGLSVSPGPHRLIIQATTNSGVHMQKTFNVTSQ